MRGIHRRAVDPRKRAAVLAVFALALVGGTLWAYDSAPPRTAAGPRVTMQDEVPPETWVETVPPPIEPLPLVPVTPRTYDRPALAARDQPAATPVPRSVPGLSPTPNASPTTAPPAPEVTPTPSPQASVLPTLDAHLKVCLKHPDLPKCLTPQITSP